MGMKKLCIALVAIALGAETVAPASAAPEGNTIIEITSVAHGTCLATTAQGTYRPSLATCDGSATQRFERVPAASGGEFLRSLDEWGLCLDRLQLSWQLLLASCNTESAGQRIELVPGPADTFKLRVQDKVAEVPYADFAVLFEPDSHYDVQQWRIREVGIAPALPELAAKVRLKSAGSYDACVMDAGGKPVMRSCAAASNQAFERVDLGDDKVALRAANGKCLANQRFSEVILTTCAAGATAQQWKHSRDELGHYKIWNPSTAQYLRPNSDGTLAANDYWGIGLAQKWLLPAA